MKQVITLCFVVIFAVALATQIAAKRGCNYYGHSCYGGHGKRSAPIEIFPRAAYKAEADSLSLDPLVFNEPPRDYNTYRLMQRMIRELIESKRQERNDFDGNSNEIFKESPPTN